MAKKVFNKAAFNGRVLNYVWCNKDVFDPAIAGVPCGVPLHYLDVAIANARRYPDTAVNVWLDNALLDKTSLAMTQEHLQKAGSGNLKLRDLGEIPSFEEERKGIFDPHRDVVALRGLTPEQVNPRQHHNIWGRVDFARLLVIDHCLKTTTAQDIIYSDFDAPDAKLNNPKAQSLLDEYGMAFGGVQPGLKDGDARIEIENGYMSFRRNKMDKKLFGTIINTTRARVTEGHDGYGPYYQKLSEWFGRRDIQFPMSSKDRPVPARNMDRILFTVTPPMDTKIPFPQSYAGRCINPAGAEPTEGFALAKPAPATAVTRSPSQA